MIYHGRMMPIFSRAISDAGVLRTIQYGGRDWGGVQFYFDRWNEFEMPAEDDPSYASIQRGVKNGYLEIREGPAPKGELDTLKEELARTKAALKASKKELATARTK